ncbi:Spy0128 family protein [Parafannyhessea umbonata]|uniref:Pilin isopeptide linkage domain-containing protein n=1 Tax=Parafannyhessea umbonata TaxID=604330 RepID=A0A1H1NU75_9ACTN|nr:FctA domain-containing protein [Parafannyhessea umbonata]SDS02305.1 pilin isopeptide linkage domain-containing protein [Parafannyhessea umbonata]
MKIKHRLIAAALTPALLLLAALFPSNALAIEGDATTVKVPVTVTTSGQGIPGETYTVEIEAETYGAPIPSASKIDVKGEELKADTYKGDPAEFYLDFSKARVGIYKYRISQVAPKNTTGRGEYDGTVYYMTVTYEHPNGDMGKTLVTAAVHEGTPEGTKVAVCNFTNTYANLPAGEIDPPVTKKIAGDKPAKKSTFDFVLESIDGAPLPEGAKDGKLTTSIEGEGTIEFGKIDYTKAGTYEYRCYEIDKGEDGYTYDNTVYTMRVAVTEGTKNFKVERAIVDKNGKEHDSLTFVNTYKAPAKPATVKKGGSGVVKTGDTNNVGAVVALGVIGAVAVAGAVVMRRDNKKEEK